MSIQIQISNREPKYNLKERTSLFGENIIIFLKKLPDNFINRPLIGQLIRSATSIGANYMEADGAVSKKDFYNKIGICKKEAKETTHWIRMISIANANLNDECALLWQEAYELALIFSSIMRRR